MIKRERQRTVRTFNKRCKQSRCRRFATAGWKIDTDLFQFVSQISPAIFRFRSERDMPADDDEEINPEVS